MCASAVHVFEDINSKKNFFHLSSECVKDNDLRCKRNMDRCRSVTGVTTKIKNTFPELTYIDQTTSSGDDSDLTLP